MVVQIWAKLSYFVCEYSLNISCKFYCQMPIAHSVFKQTVLNVCPPVVATHDRNLLQNDTNFLSMNSWNKSFCIVDKMFFHLGIALASFCMCLMCSSIGPHMIIHWHIHMVHFLLFLHQNYSLVTGSLRKMYF